MVAIGLAGTVLHLALVGTAFEALREVNAAHDDVERISSAQADFQEADMAHDAMRADVLALLLPGSGAAEDDAAAALARDVAEYRGFLREVDRVPLPRAIGEQLRAVRPLQERYAADVLRVGDAAETDPRAARALLPGLTAEFTELTVQQRTITAAMASEADRLGLAAEQAERDVRWRLGASATAALLGMLGLTLLLRRLGGALADTLARERGVAETLQHRLMPDRLPHLPGVRLAARYVPGAVGSEVGGDWYDVVPLPSGEVGLVMGDVAGHDLEAAASMGQLRNALRACAADGDDPGDVLGRLNLLCLQQGLGGMATVLYAVLDPVQGTLRMANAGHYPPLLVAGAERRFLEVDPRPPVGAVREAVYPTTRHLVPPGSLLLLYTDGLVEHRDMPVEEGMARLLALAQPPSDDGPLEPLSDALLTGMLGGEHHDDDVALLAVQPQTLLGPRLELMLPAEADQLVVLRRTLSRWLGEAGADEDELYEITVACSEAVSNAMEHAYGPVRAWVGVAGEVSDGAVRLEVRDWGRWREARGRDRGRGLFLMRGLMDDVVVEHGDHGTRVVLRRRLAGRPVSTRPAATQPVATQPAATQPATDRQVRA